MRPLQINILINSQCRAVITNFGTAHHPATNDLSKKKERAMEEPRTAPPVEATYCTSTNTLTLTGIHCAILWAAPEVLEGDESSIASDIWALGWVAYEVRYRLGLLHDWCSTTHTETGDDKLCPISQPQGAHDNP